MRRVAILAVIAAAAIATPHLVEAGGKSKHHSSRSRHKKKGTGTGSGSGSGSGVATGSGSDATDAGSGSAGAVDPSLDTVDLDGVGTGSAATVGTPITAGTTTIHGPVPLTTGTVNPTAPTTTTTITTPKTGTRSGKTSGTSAGSRGGGAATVEAGAAAASVSAAIDRVASNDTTLRFTLSSFLYRETGSAGPVLLADAAAAENASPVRRFFGDMRVQLSIDRIGGGDMAFELDGRVRQTTSQLYQSGADGGSEYELRRLAVRRRFGGLDLKLGRQFVDPVGATKIDGVVATLRLSPRSFVTAFGGAYPARASRTVGTDYPKLDLVGGGGSRLIPLTVGGALSYRTPNLHGDVGLGAIHASQTDPAATGWERSRVFTTTSAYWRPSPVFNVYHYGMVDLGGGAHLTNGSLGVDVYPTPPLELSLAAHHVDTELLEIAATNLLEDPDPDTQGMGVVQNGVEVYRVSQDLLRGAISVALARARFEITIAGSVHRRPAIDVTLLDGTMLTFPEATMADATMSVLDRRSIAGLRIQASGSLLRPIGDQSPSRSRGVVARLLVARPFARNRGQIAGDLMLESLHDLGPRTGCTTLASTACFGTSNTTAFQAGVLTTFRANNAWLVLFDGHLGVRSTSSIDTATQTVSWPSVLSLTAFVRLQWRYD